MVNASKKKLNSKFVKVKAPVMMLDTGKNIKEPVWMEKDFFPNLLDTIKEYKIELTTIKFMHQYVKIGFKDYKHATKFRLIYEGKEYK
jgi:hypothetical protein